MGGGVERIVNYCYSVGETESLAEKVWLGEWMQSPADLGIFRDA